MGNPRKADDELRWLKKKIVAYLVTGLLLLDFGICALTMGWSNSVVVVISTVTLALGATPALIKVFVLNRRKNKLADPYGSRPWLPPLTTRR